MADIYQVKVVFNDDKHHSGARIKQVSKPYIPDGVRIGPDAESRHTELKDDWVYDSVIIVGSSKLDVEDHASYLRGVLLR